MFQEVGVCIYFPLPCKIFLELGYVPCRKKANVLHLNQCTTEKPKEGWMDRWRDGFTSSERHFMPQVPKRGKAAEQEMVISGTGLWYMVSGWAKEA